MLLIPFFLVLLISIGASFLAARRKSEYFLFISPDQFGECREQAGLRQAVAVDAIVPTNRQAKVTNKTEVVGTAVESLQGSDATAIVYTNTTSTSPLLVEYVISPSMPPCLPPTASIRKPTSWPNSWRSTSRLPSASPAANRSPPPASRPASRSRRDW